MINQDMAQFIGSHLRARRAVLELGFQAEILEKLNRAIKLMDDIARGDTIESGWSVEDVFSLTADEDYEFNYDADGKPIAPSDITADEARNVLKLADSEHDASIGINWEVLEYHLDYIRRK